MGPMAPIVPPSALPWAPRGWSLDSSSCASRGPARSLAPRVTRVLCFGQDVGVQNVGIVWNSMEFYGIPWNCKWLLSLLSLNQWEYKKLGNCKWRYFRYSSFHVCISIFLGRRNYIELGLSLRHFLRFRTQRQKMKTADISQSKQKCWPTTWTCGVLNPVGTWNYDNYVNTWVAMASMPMKWSQHNACNIS